MSKPKLISFKLCPYVQRSVITMLHKGVDFDIEYIDLSNKPDWFVAISPLGKVPVLRVDDVVLFESAVINEYLDETNGDPLMPSDPLARAQHRAWIEFASAILGEQFGYTVAPNAEVLATKRAGLESKLGYLERNIGEGSPLGGAGFSLIDAAVAPFFMRAALLATYEVTPMLDPYPNLRAWSEVLLSRPEVRDSVVPEFEELFRDALVERDVALVQGAGT